jgi:hypothetical protein
VDTRPTTDNSIDFEDLIMFAINFGHVSRTLPVRATEAVPEDPRLVLAVETSGDRVIARLSLDDHTDLVQGIHALVSYDAAALELVGTTTGALAEGQSFLGAIPETNGVSVDLARLGHGATFHGNGEVAVVEFRRLAGTSLPTLGEVALRDTKNRPAGRRPAEGAVTGDPQVATSAPAATEVQLFGARPNPFGDATEIRFGLPVAATVTVRIHDVSGRLVRTLVDGTVAPGEHTARWDGRTESGDRVGSGIYFYTFRSGNTLETRKVLLTR